MSWLRHFSCDSRFPADSSSVALPLHVPTVPMRVKVPVAPMLYIETSFEPEFVTYANLPDGWIAIESGDSPAAIFPVSVKEPVVLLMVYIETSFEPEFVT
jgi:hypothetical protein